MSIKQLIDGHPRRMAWRKAWRTAAMGPVMAAALATAAPAVWAATERSEQYFQDALDRLQQGDVDAAVIQLRNAIQEDPSNLDARQSLGRIYLQRGDYLSAEKELRRAYEGQPSDQLELEFGQALLGLGNNAEVLAIVGTAADDDNVAWQKRLLRIEAQINLGQIDEVDPLVDEILQAQPLDPIVNLLSARMEALKNRPDVARDRLKTAIDVDPQSIAAWLLSAQLALSQSALSEAENAARKALELAPESPAPKLVLAEIDLRRGRLDEAESQTRAVLEVIPGNVQSTFLLATILNAQKKYEEADRAMRQIADAVRDAPQALLLSGIIKSQTDQLAQAEDLLAEYVTLVPTNRTARRLLANVQLASKRPRQAVDTMAPLIGPQSRDLVSLQLATAAQLQVGDFDGARESFRRIVALGQPQEAQQARSFLSILGNPEDTLDDTRKAMLLFLDDLRSARFDEAQERAEDLVAAAPDNAEALNMLGAVHLARGQNEQAREQLEAALAANPALQGAIDNLNRLDIREGRPEDVEARLRARIAEAPGNEGLILQLANLLVQLERADEAEALLRDKSAGMAASVPLRLALAARYRASGNTEGIATVAKELLDIGTIASNPAGFEAAGNLYLQAGDFTQAVAAFDKLAAALADNPTAHIALARAQYAAGDKGAARASLDKARELAPDSLIANNSIVDLHLQAGETEPALEFAKSLEAVDAAQSASLQAKVLLGADRADEAVEIVAKAFQGQPSANMARSLFAVRRQAGREDEAIDGLRAWLVDNPDDFAGMELLSQALLVKQDYPAAAALLEQALQLTPNNPTVLNNLAWLRHELEQAGAVDLARRAQQLAPNSPAITDTLAWILVQEGQIEEGLPLLREAQAALEDNPDIRYHLAYALNESGDKEGALDILRELQKVESEYIEKRAAEQLLRRLQ